MINDDVKYKFVMIRHGESEWNLENKFTGWHDIDLSPKGLEEAVNAGKVCLISTKLSCFSTPEFQLYLYLSILKTLIIHLMLHLQVC